MRILIADDHALVRENFRDFLLREFSDAEIDEADSYPSVAEKLTRHNDYDLIIIDLNMPGMEGRASISRINAAHPSIPIVVFSGSYESGQIEQMIDAGANGFIPKTVGGKVMKSAIDLVLSGNTYIPKEALQSSSTRKQTGPDERKDSLSPRERDVLKELLNGGTNKDIATALGIKEFTIKAHMQNIFRKLEVDNRTQVIIKAIELGYKPDQI